MSDAVVDLSADQLIQQRSRLSGTARWVMFAASFVGLLLAIDQSLNLRLFGEVLIAKAYHYAMLAAFLSTAFLAFPAHSRARGVPWYDWMLFALSIAANAYLASKGLAIVQGEYEMALPALPLAASIILCLLALEGVRRTGGPVLFVICLFFALYPLFAERMPGFLWGVGLDLKATIAAHALGNESITGIAFQTVVDLLIGYLVFGVALVVTGGGDFFMDFANALMGRQRGGPAKVAVISSGLQGMISGSVVSNVITSGVMTIPAMQRCGYKPAYAAAVEACSSTGGAIMPPVMGAAAFIMASFLNVPYGDVVMAAIVPGCLFYLALVFQADLYAARVGLKGLPEGEIPNLWQTVKDGWLFLFSLAALTYMLLVMRMETHAAFAATGLLLLAALFKRKNRLNFTRFVDLIVESGVSIAQLVAILAGIGFLVGSLSITGVANAFSRELIQYAGGSQTLLLVLGAVTSFVLGMGMTVSSCYIFLAIVLAPALVASGMNPMVSHLFILYYGTLSYITPPVALASISAAAINKSNAIVCGLYSMRLGIVLFIVPFVFVLNPSLVMIGDWREVTQAVSTAALGTWLIASGFEAYLYWVGRVSIVTAGLLIVAGALLFVPGWKTDLAGLAIIGVVYGWHMMRPSGRVAA